MISTFPTNQTDLERAIGCLEESTVRLQKILKGRFVSVRSHFPGKIRKKLERHLEVIQNLRSGLFCANAEMLSRADLALHDAENVKKKWLKRLNAKAISKLGCSENYHLLSLSRLPAAAASSSSSPSSALSPISSIPSHRLQWYQNLGSLIKVYQRTDRQEIKKFIGFLVYNYLAKAAPICPRDLLIGEVERNELYSLFQLSPFEPGISYNRESNLFDSFLREEVNKELAPGTGQIIYMVDHTEIEEFFPLWYTIIRPGVDSAFSSSEDFLRAIQNHLACHPHDYADKFFDHPLILDLTSLIGDRIQTSGNPEKELSFKKAIEQLEKSVEQSIDFAISQCPIEEAAEKQKLKALVLANLTCVCRCQVRSVSILKEIPFFYHPKFFSLADEGGRLLGIENIPSVNFTRALLDIKWIRSRDEMDNFLSGTGLRLGSVAGRKKVLDFLTLERLVESLECDLVMTSLERENRIILGKSDLMILPVFLRLESLFSPDDEKATSFFATKKYCEVFLRPTLQLLRGLFDEITTERWDEYHRDLDLREIIQGTMFKIFTHLINVERNLDDFSKCVESIELIHYEIAALLAIFSPFQQKEFPDIFRARLECNIPEALRAHVKAGLTKSAMNTFAGLGLALGQQSLHPVRAFHEGSHFEIVDFVGESQEFSKVIQDPTIERVDLFLGEYNHNVRLKANHDHYTPGNVVGDVEAILAAKPHTEHLTVAVDCTIDFINSSRVRALLEHFSEGIQSGRLNFVFFSSGQKFGMFGMDNYYLAPWYMVNNSAPHWEPFNILSSHPGLQTDTLSTQWFCLVNKYAPAGLDQYKKVIFDNTREILHHVPAILLPGGNPSIKVCSVDEGMESCFLDIKCYGEESGELINKFQERLYQIFLARHAKIHSRGGYGYFNPNITLFSERLDSITGIKYSTMRLHPGINSEEIPLFIEFLSDLAILALGIRHQVLPQFAPGEAPFFIKSTHFGVA